MAYERYDTRGSARDEGPRWRDERFDRGRRDERGFFERAGDEVASWFGDEDAERRRREDQMRYERERGWSGRDRDFGRANYGRDWERDRGRRDWYETRGLNERGGFSESDYNPGWRRELSRPEYRESAPDRERGYRPMTGDYGRSERSASDTERDYDRSQTPYGLDEYRRTSFAGSRERDYDPHYRSWRDRHLSELDRDYEDYRHENQARFEREFGTWRERRMQKRELLGRIREHMEVVGNDDQHVGTVDRIAGDRIILTKSDPESGGVHHSMSCSDVDRIEGDRVILDLTAEQARQRWRDESRSRALFEREDQGEMGPRTLNRSFEGTYR